AGLGPKLIDRFIDLGWVKDPADLFTLDYDQVAQREGMGEKSAAKLKAAMEAAKDEPLWRPLNALGIRHVGERTAGLRARRSGSIERRRAATVQGIHGIGGSGTARRQSG